LWFQRQNGQAGAALAPVQRPAIVVLKSGLGSATGMEVIANARENHQNPEIARLRNALQVYRYFSFMMVQPKSKSN